MTTGVSGYRSRSADIRRPASACRHSDGGRRDRSGQTRVSRRPRGPGETGDAAAGWRTPPRSRAPGRPRGRRRRRACRRRSGRCRRRDSGRARRRRRCAASVVVATTWTAAERMPADDDRQRDRDLHPAEELVAAHAHGRGRPRRGRGRRSAIPAYVLTRIGGIGQHDHGDERRVDLEPELRVDRGGDRQDDRDDRERRQGPAEVGEVDRERRAATGVADPEPDRQGDRDGDRRATPPDSATCSGRRAGMPAGPGPAAPDRSARRSVSLTRSIRSRLVQAGVGRGCPGTARGVASRA